jgi:hypothetical protein
MERVRNRVGVGDRHRRRQLSNFHRELALLIGIREGRQANCLPSRQLRIADRQKKHLGPIIDIDAAQQVQIDKGFLYLASDLRFADG